MRFLVVDDDANSRRILELFLKPYGTCVTAANGEEASFHFQDALQRRNPFSVIYLDIFMPDTSGLVLLEDFRLKERRLSLSQAPVVMLTGDAAVSNINKAQLLGVVEYLIKPICERRLIQGLERLDLLNCYAELAS